MPCTDLHGMSLVVVVFLVEELILYAELLGVAGLRVETLYSKKSCSSCRNVETPLYSKIEESLLGSSLSSSLEIILFTELLYLSG